MTSEDNPDNPNNPDNPDNPIAEIRNSKKCPDVRWLLSAIRFHVIFFEILTGIFFFML